MRKTNRLLAALLCVVLLVSLLPAVAFAEIVEGDGVYTALNFFDCEAKSTNAHYVVDGLFVDETEDVYLILRLNKNATVKEILAMGVHLHDAYGNITSSHMFTDPDVTTTVCDSVTLNFADGTKKVFTNKFGYVVAKAGTLEQYQQSFYLTVDAGAGGWSITGKTDLHVELNLGYEITKTADLDVAYAGDTVGYIIEIKNTGDWTVSGINVYDDVPDGLVILAVDGHSATVDNNGRLVLDENISLAKQTSKSYYVEAMVTDDVQGEVITNTATIESETLFPLNDSADVLANPYFEVVHQQGETDRIFLDEINGTFDITEPVPGVYDGITEGYIYGGLATDEDFDEARSDVCGKELEPKNGQTYYLREVDMHYLLPATLFVWGADGSGGYETDTYLATDIDKAGVDGSFYKQYGFLTDDGKIVGSIEVVNGVRIDDKDCALYPTITVGYKDREDSVYSVTDVFKYDSVSDADYFGCKVYKIAEEYPAFTFTPYFVTADNVLVPGVLTRSVAANVASVQRPAVTDDWSNRSTEKIPQLKSKLFVSAKSFAIAPAMTDSRVTITMMDGEAASTCKVEPGDYTGKLAAAEKEGFLFAGWYADAALTVPADLSDVQADITVYAKYISDSYCKLAIVKANGAKKYDAVIAADSAYAQVGYIFAANGSEKKVPMSVSKAYGAQAIFGKDVAADALVYCDNLKANKLPKNAAITLTPYFVLADGTVLYGEAQTYLCNGSELKAVNG